MKPNQLKRWSTILLVSIIILAGCVFIAGIVLSKNASGYLRNSLKKSLPTHVSVDFDTCEVNLFSRSIIIKNVKGSIHNKLDASIHHSVEIDKLSLSGIHILSFLLNKEIEINNILFDTINLALSKELLYNSDSTFIKQSDQNRTQDFKSLTIDNFKINKLNLKVAGDSTKEIEAKIELKLADIKIQSFERLKETLHFELQESKVSDILITPDTSFYNFSVKSIEVDNSQNIIIDSIKVIPRYAKYDFGKRAGKQIDRLQAIIPELKINHIHTSSLYESMFHISSLYINDPTLIAFRDKRQPFIKDKKVPLPIDLIRKFPYKFSIDTINLLSASITYEEFPVEGDSSGSVRFENLNASIFNLTNDTTSIIDHVDLDVETTFMNTGLLKASFDLPLRKGKRYTANGSLSGFPLPELNPAVEPLAKMRIESGAMKLLSFQFTYDDLSSLGEVEMNYENLKILSLKEKEKKTIVDKLKTFLINTFIAKNKNENTPEENRKGTIEFTRDPKRSIFNYWWKSLFTGVKDCYGIGKAL